MPTARRVAPTGSTSSSASSVSRGNGSGMAGCPPDGGPVVLVLCIHAGAALHEHRQTLNVIVARNEERAEALARVHDCRNKEPRSR